MARKRCDNENGRSGGCTIRNDATGRKYHTCNPKTCIKYIGVL